MSRCGVICQKLGMSQIFAKNGDVIPVTVLGVEKNEVICTKVNQNGDSSVQIAAFNQKEQRVSKSLLGIFKKAKVSPKKIIKEFVVDQAHLLQVGDYIDAGFFKKGQFVDVTGTTLGKGFAGVMKRHGFKGLEASHGVSVKHRSAGSTGQCQDPGKVFKGKKMAGRYGGVNNTVQNIKVVDIDLNLQLVIIQGAVSGYKGGFLVIRDAVKNTRGQ